jgi:hypothetical protein
MRGLFCAAVAVSALLTPAAAVAQADQGDPQGQPFALRTSFKTSLLPFRAPDAPEIFPERAGVESLSRFRLEPTFRVGERLLFEGAYEHRVRYASTPAALTTVGILPSDAVAPYRIWALDWSLAQSSNAVWRHEIDRANVRIRAGAVNLTVGRQAIGWGRGVMFGAVDLFSPFSPLEADREWRRGVDAVRADVKLTDRSSVDVLGAFASTWNDSAVAGRVRGYAGSVDLELMGGRRASDWFGGVTSSAAVGDAEVHGELAVFRVPRDPLDDNRLVWKAVLGASWRFPIGAGILAYGEYHYSGFGATRPELIVPLLLTPSFRERYLRGDTQILSRHAVAALLSYEASTTTIYAGQWIHNPLDHSGVLAPGITYTFSDHLSLVGTLYLPYGQPPDGLLLRSVYGASALAGLFQLRVYV